MNEIFSEEDVNIFLANVTNYSLKELFDKIE